MKKTLVMCCCWAWSMCAVQAQNLDGFWKGTLGMRGCFPENNIELQLSIKDGRITGDSYHYWNVDNYVKKKLIGRYDQAQKKLTLQEGLVTTHHIPFHCVICIKSFDLEYSREGNTETLKGNWGGHVLNSLTDCGVGPIILTRIKESAFKEVPEIKVDTGTIRLDFYDNAEVDGDTITVKVNNKIVLAHQRLSGKPATLFLKVDPNNTFYEVEMIAENQGSIPPNTAILVITAGTKKHHLWLSSTDVKTARIRFVYEPEKEERTVLQEHKQVSMKGKG